MVFTIHECGFVARLAVEDTGGSEMRIDKITRIIRESCYSIHDISRVEGTGPSNLPRFNMPFEAGLAMGATRFEPANSHRRDFLLLDAVKHRDKMTLSDLAGQDAKSHENDPVKLVGAVRGFLAAKAKGTPMRGPTAISRRFGEFTAALPAICKSLDITPAEMSSFGFMPEWTAAMVGWQRRPA